VSDGRAKEHLDEGIEGSDAKGNGPEGVWLLRLFRGGRKGMGLTSGPCRLAGGRARGGEGRGVGPQAWWGA
jgi:hypothetical protein